MVYPIIYRVSTIQGIQGQPSSGLSDFAGSTVTLRISDGDVRQLLVF